MIKLFYLQKFTFFSTSVKGLGFRVFRHSIGGLRFRSMAKLEGTRIQALRFRI